MSRGDSRFLSSSISVVTVHSVPSNTLRDIPSQEFDS